MILFKETFMCAFNNLTSIPESLCQCKNLKTLIINDNDLQTVPVGIYGMKNLKVNKIKVNFL